jgi:hypothetical protein
MKAKPNYFIIDFNNTTPTAQSVESLKKKHKKKMQTI